jgi:hypothetical protein
MSYIVDFNNVSTTGLESSPVAPALAGLRANESRCSVVRAGSAASSLTWRWRRAMT